ncbi:DUF4437 domain-containing protein [Sphingomonas crocodyli]|uniref:DUF4437 domain-containing protein n=1 Tax=Sphingomonas crocodyli TaxID=1979270 RepID=A0A437M6P4_9SPHN|nr:DUF4437 domain-containing protein [Sphingomonas crocodyli]RVT93319.1 DUF4437 domain-containing protein [Sphingomonas crocodyli]
MPISNRLRLGLTLCSTVLLGTSALAADIRIPESRDRATEFVGFVQPSVLHLRPLVFPGLPTAEFKQLSFDEKTGARTILAKLPAGWKQPSGYHSADLEMFVVEGGLSIGTKPVGRYGYAYYPAGYAHSYGTEKGATVLMFWAGAPDYTASAKSKAGTKAADAIDGLAYNDIAVTGPASLPKYRDEPVMKNSPVHVRLLRLDPKTGQKTWIAMSPGGYPVMSGEGDLPLWASSKSWQEGYMLAGDMTVAECLPEGQVAGTYGTNGYFFRPAGTAHGGLSQYSDSFAVWLYRTGPGHWETYRNQCVEPAAKAAGGAK